MSIYSANRSGRMATATIAANESYAFNDCNRVIYECQVNDMVLFESILANDFREIHGLNEGTILEAEVSTLNREALKDLAEKIIKSQYDFLAKINGIFVSAIANINAHAKAASEFVDEFHARVGDKITTWTGSIDNVARVTLNDEAFVYPKAEELFGFDADMEPNQMMEHLLSSRCEDTTPDTFVCKVLGKLSRNESLTASNIEEYCDDVKTGDKHGRILASYMLCAEDAVNELVSKIKEKVASDENVTATQLVNIVNAFETTQCTIVNAIINAVRADIKSCRIALGRAMDDMMGTDATVAEAAAIDAASDFDDASPTTAIDPETRAQIDELIATAGEEKE